MGVLERDELIGVDVPVGDASGVLVHPSVLANRVASFGMRKLLRPGRPRRSCEGSEADSELVPSVGVTDITASVGNSSSFDANTDALPLYVVLHFCEPPCAR